MTSSATALLRLLLQRAGDDRHRIFLIGWTSVDWQSLTFNGERHTASFVLTGRDADALAERWTDGLGDAEFDLPAGFVAEIGLVAQPSRREDGSVVVELEALTLAD
ncbi:MAG TPA: hypothetical protein VM913_07925 [Sphingomicrobium sp.]|jgi:hypothetical protein|nr:hypothetical protein [Sphingomicrobium sp.]